MARYPELGALPLEVPEGMVPQHAVLGRLDKLDALLNLLVIGIFVIGILVIDILVIGDWAT